MHGNRAHFSPADGNRAPSAAAPTEQIAYKFSNAARVIDVSERQMWELIRTGEIPSFKIGAARRITRAALEAFIESRSTDQPSAA